MHQSQPQATAVAQVDAPTSAWLQQHTDACNARLEAQRQRTPRAPAARILAGIADVLPRWVAALDELTDGTTPASERDALLFAIFDLVVLHAARDTLARPAVFHLLHALPRSRLVLALCATAPRTIPASLSNAAERLGEHGVAFIDAMIRLAPSSDTPAFDAPAWLRLGAIVAWRLGDPRFRGAALAELETVPAATLLGALGLDEWPVALAEIVRAGLLRDAWWNPRELQPAGPDGRGDSTGNAGAAASLWHRAQNDSVARIELQSQVGRRRGSAPLERWTEVAQLGDFIGLGGPFLQPPQVVAVASPYVLFAAVGSETFRVDADVFGARIAPCALEDVPGLGDDVAEAEVEPTLQRAITRLQAAQTAAGATSLLAGPGAIAWTHRTSHRIRLLLPPLATVDSAAP